MGGAVADQGAVGVGDTVPWGVWREGKPIRAVGVGKGAVGVIDTVPCGVLGGGAD